jgi:hypothetical protein
MTDQPFITINRGGPSPDNDIPDGVYPLQLIGLSDPRPVEATRGPNAGKTINLIDWSWTIDWPGNPLDERTLDSSTSDKSGPKSKMYAYLTALFGGTPPPVGTQLGKADLVGRRVLGTVNHDEDGWVRLANVSALPPQMQQPTAPAMPVLGPTAPAAGAPADPTPASSAPLPF